MKIYETLNNHLVSRYHSDLEKAKKHRYEKYPDIYERETGQNVIANFEDICYDELMEIIGTTGDIVSIKTK